MGAGASRADTGSVVRTPAAPTAVHYLPNQYQQQPVYQPPQYYPPQTSQRTNMMTQPPQQMGYPYSQQQTTGPRQVDNGSMSGQNISGAMDSSPHTPTVPRHSQPERPSSGHLMNTGTYGEEDFALREMTLPRDNIQQPYCNLVANQMLYYGSSSDEEDQIAQLITNQELMDSELFIKAMELKRKEYESAQVHLFGEISVPRQVDDMSLVNITELLSSFCYIHHILYGGTNDELGVEFEPSANEAEDEYILEKLNNLCERHTTQLRKMDEDFGRRLLEYAGGEMTWQKLDSLLEEHIKLRYYLRTKQTKDQVEAYQEVRTRIMENPGLVRVSMSQSVTPAVQEPTLSTKLDHPIASRLPQLNTAHILRYYSRNHKRDSDNQSESENDDKPDDQIVTSAPVQSKLNAARFQSGIPHSAQSASLVKRETGNQYTTNSRDCSDQSQDPCIRSQRTDNVSMDYATQDHNLRPMPSHQNYVQQEPGMPYATHDTIHAASDHKYRLETTGANTQTSASASITVGGFQVVSMNPKFVGGFSLGKELPQPSSNVPGPAIPPQTATIVVNKPSSDSDEEEDGRDQDDERAQRSVDGDFRKKVRGGFAAALKNKYGEKDPLDAFAENHASDRSSPVADGNEDDDDDLLNQYKKTMNIVSSDESSDSESRTRYKQLGETAVAATADEKLMASQKLDKAVTDALWSHEDSITPDSFGALMDIWKQKQENVEKSKNIEKISQKANAKKLWRRATKRVSEKKQKDTGTAPTKTQSSSSSSSMQTSLGAGDSASSQTDGRVMVDAETWIDEMFDKDTITKDIEEMDADLAQRLAEPNINSEDVDRLLHQHADIVNRLRQQREQQQKEALARLKARRNRGKEDSDSQGSESDTEIQDQVEEIDEEFQLKFRLNVGELDEETVQRILSESRRKQEEIVKQRQREKLRLKQRINQRKREKQSVNPPELSLNELNQSYREFYDLYKEIKSHGGKKEDVLNLLEQLKEKEQKNIPTLKTDLNDKDSLQAFETMKMKSRKAKDDHLNTRMRAKEEARSRMARKKERKNRKT